jgi:hypothetical protein
MVASTRVLLYLDEVQLPQIEKALMHDVSLASRATNFASIVCISVRMGNRIHGRITLLKKLDYLAKSSVEKVRSEYLHKTDLASLAGNVTAASVSDTIKFRAALRQARLLAAGVVQRARGCASMVNFSAPHHQSATKLWRQRKR